MTALKRLFERSVPVLAAIVFMVMSVPACAVGPDRLELQPLLEEALKNNRELLAMEARAVASMHRVAQARSLPDPMFMFGYQNDGLKRYTYGDSPDAKWMFSASQMFPFPGKRDLKGEMAAADTEGIRASYQSLRLKVAARVKELFYDLSLLHKNLEVLKVRAEILSKIEEAALARYASGMAPQQDVLMAQTEIYMLQEREEMLRQKIPTLEAMLSLAAGRASYSPLGVPVLPPASLTYDIPLEDLIRRAQENSPDVRAKKQMIAAAEAKLGMAKREYFPDVTLDAGVEVRGGEYTDMYRATSTINIPLYFKTKQEPAVYEAAAALQEAKHDLEGMKIMVAAGIRENYAMIKSAERLMDLYRNSLIPKASQSFDVSLSQYTAGKSEAGSVIARLKTLLDFDLAYWGQYTDKEKAVARLEALATEAEAAPEVPSTEVRPK